MHTIGFGKEKLAHDLEITDAEVPPRALPESRLAAMVHLHQHGYAGQKVKINVKEGDKILASQEVTLKPDGVEQVEQVLFSAGPAGVKTIQVVRRSAAQRGKRPQQFGHATGERGRPEAQDPLF